MLPRKILLDGTNITACRHGNDPQYYSGKHKTNGFNIQILANLSGKLLYVCHLYTDASMTLQLFITACITYINPKHIIADKGHIDTKEITPLEEK